MSISWKRTRRRRTIEEMAEFLAQTEGGTAEDYIEQLMPNGKPFNDKWLIKDGYEPVKQYNYTAPDGTLLYQSCRYHHKHIKDAKTFVQRKQDPDTGEWLNGAGPIKVPYRWQALAARPDEDVFVTEGEKDADRLADLGLLATTVAGQNWSDTAIMALQNCNVFVLEDNDQEGRDNASASAEALQGIAKSIRIVRLPGLGHKEDVSDWLDAAHSLEDLRRITEHTKPEPSSAAPNVIDPSSWEGQPIPERVWVVDPLIPALNIALLYGDGGLGKSLLAAMLAVARATRQQWLGLQTTPGRTLVISAEDDAEEMHRRLAAIALHYNVRLADLGDIRLIDLVGQDAVIGELSRNGRIVATELYRFVVSQIASFNPGLIIVDALADSFAGDENNRTQARQFISMLRRVTVNHNCSFLTVAHPSLSGITTGRGTSGTTGWSNSVRSRMYFETVEATEGGEPDPNLKVLRQPKANYSAGGFEMAVRYQNGVYVPVEGDERLDQRAKMAQHESIFMATLVRLAEQERWVSDSTSSAYAPAVFVAEAEAREKRLTKAQLKAAMVRLFEKNTIMLEMYGPPSRQRRRIVVAPL